MDDVIYRELITKQAAEIKGKLQGATLYGHPINPENLDEMLVATKCMLDLFWGKQLTEVKIQGMRDLVKGRGKCTSD